MIRFPETVAAEWKTVSDVEDRKEELKRKIEHDLAVERELERMRQRHEANVLLQQEIAAEGTPKLEMVTLADFNANPSATPTDLIEGVVRKDGLTLVLGPSGSGKSTLALQMLYSLMTGDDWLGQTAKPLMGSVGILSYDMEASMMLDWMAGFPNVDPSKISVVNAHNNGNPLGVPAYRKQIADAWRRMDVEVVVIDSFSATFKGHDQNDAAATQAHYLDLSMFALNECGAKAAIVIVHSAPGSPYKARGSTVHHDVADCIVGVAVDEKTMLRQIEMVKYRAPRGMQGMDPVIIGKPDDVTHLVSLDTGAMSLAGMKLPPNVIAMTFPDTHEDPQVFANEDTTEEGDEDL